MASTPVKLCGDCSHLGPFISQFQQSVIVLFLVLVIGSELTSINSDIQLNIVIRPGESNQTHSEFSLPLRLLSIYTYLRLIFYSRQ